MFAWYTGNPTIFTEKLENIGTIKDGRDGSYIPLHIASDAPQWTMPSYKEV
jgi:hypothetical protein